MPEVALGKALHVITRTTYIPQPGKTQGGPGDPVALVGVPDIKKINRN